MPESNQRIRLDVVQAVLSAILDQDQDGLRTLADTGVTQAELSQAENLITASLHQPH